MQQATSNVRTKPDKKKQLIMGGGAAIALAVAAFLLLRSGGDGPQVDPKIVEKANQIEANLRAVNPDPPVAAIPTAPPVEVSGSPAPKSLRNRNK